MIRGSKRKLPEKTSKRRVQTISKREPSNTEGSCSDSNPSNQSTESNASDDNDRSSRHVKRLRRDNIPKFQKRLRPRNIPKHKKHSMYPLSRHKRRLGLRSQSSSPENHVVKKSPEKNTLSPLQTRSQRNNRERDRAPYIHHCLRARTLKPQKYRNSGDSSESDESVHNRRSAQTFNSSSSSNTSSRNLRRHPIATKNQESPFNETEESSDQEEEEDEEEEEEEEKVEKTRSSTRATTATTRDKPKTRRALKTVPTKESPRKHFGRIQTRNRGQRTVMYGEDSDDEMDAYKNSDSENTEPMLSEPMFSEPMFSFSSRGRLRKLTNHARAFFRE